VKQGGQPRMGEGVNSLGGGTTGGLCGKVTEA